ncbi:XrtA/PEP-CTERM system TPR-repeat protein PrsT [Chromatocurvus halotolerans]|uniref:Putative PEP-CTERM system TPR-repeat lipoprotein n=1 Tax=Chromatocurvus halotolerans TaxID=1132028 RepID=A0A4R2L5A8_9GAMM|nr:XrtA/PEP-CTERM system TPR-repeat protein PrsT [Chromatocurvus halotolerans]TCO74335.1 putative PEP-CTERM system TPR-repeat lipoprotein [Chromatocurvus halotolerans]
MRPRITAVLLACLTVAFLGACSSPETEQELLARASTALEAGNINAATVDIKTALQKNPDSGAARLLLGEAYMRQRDPAAAVTEFRRAVENQGGIESHVRYAQARAELGETGSLLAAQAGESPPGSEDARYQAAVARAHSLNGDFDAAREALDRALSIDGDNPYVQVTEALLLLREGSGTFDGAEILARVTEAFPENDEAWSLRADVARFEKDFASAAQWYAKAADINPFRMTERLRLVLSLIELGDTDAASKRLAELEKVMPDHPGVNFSRGRMLVEAGRYEEGLQALSQVLSVLPNHAATLYIAATANIQQGNLATGQRQLTKLVRDQPGNVPARLQLASLTLRQDDPRSAERMAREVLKENSMNIAAMRILAMALASQGQYAESAQVYQEVAALLPDSAQDRAGLGAAQLMSGEAEVGTQGLKQAVAMDPGNMSLRERLIELYLAQGDGRSARDAVAEYLTVAKDQDRSRAFAAGVALQLGDEAKAKKLFEAVTANDSGNIAANSGLAILALRAGRFDEGRAYFNAALKAHPGDARTLMNLAVLEEQAGDMAAMVAALEQAVTADGSALEPRLALARYRLGQERPQEATRLLEAVRAEYPDEFDLHQLLARSYLAQEETSSAASSGRQMLRLRPEDPATLAQVARIEQLDGRPQKAAELVEKALVSAPDNVALRKLFVEILLAEEELDRALSELQKLPSAVREEPMVMAIEGRLALAQGRPADAERLFQRLFDTNPGRASLLLLSSAKWAKGEPREGKAVLENWLQDNPDDNVIRNELAARELVLGNNDAARKHYEILLAAAPENPTVLNNLAWLSRETAPEKALDYAQKAVEHSSGDIQMLDTLAMVQRSLGNVEEALMLSDRILGSGERMGPELEYHRALILLDAGLTPDAVRVLESLAGGAAFPQQAEARELLDSLR